MKTLRLAIAVIAVVFFITVPVLAEDPPWIFGMHDNGGESVAVGQGKRIWVLMTEELGRDPNNFSGPDYRWLTDAGHGVIARLNHGYYPNGTIPLQQYYADFATRCANFVRSSKGCHIWIIGNEMNLSVEWPNGVEITPTLYASCFLMCRNAIRGVTGHANDWVIPGALCPSGQSAIQWFNNMVNAIGASNIDGFAIHCYTSGHDPALVFSDAKDAQGYYTQFRAYKNFMSAIPTSLRHLPVFITETDPGYSWNNVNNGWVKNVYIEINNWNTTPGNQPIRSVCLYRWQCWDQWCISDKPAVIQDWREAMANDYRWSSSTGTISGYVRDMSSNPIAGASVSTNTGGYSTTSGTDGSYTLSNVAPATYSVTASKSGYNSQTKSNIVVTAGQTTTCNFNLVRQTGTISGSVKDIYNNPIGDATVTTNPGGYVASTQPDGSYTLSGVPTGTYDVIASKSGYGLQCRTGQIVSYNQTTTVNFNLVPVISIGSAKTRADGSSVAVVGIVTAKFPVVGTQDRLYIEAADRSAGIGVITATLVKLGDEVSVEGTMGTSNSERVINASTVAVTRAAQGVPKPLAVNNRNLGGGQFGLQPAVIDDATANRYSTASNNVGLLVGTTGRVTYVDSSGTYFYVDDGSALRDGSGQTGIRVACAGLPLPRSGEYVTLVGISGIAQIGGKPARLLRPRSVEDLSYASDVNYLANPSFETGTYQSWTSYGSVEGPQTGTWFGGITARSGSWFFGNAAHGGTKSGGLYQRVAVRPGYYYVGKVWSRVYRGDNPTDSCQNKIGIDPTGGTDPNSANIKWSSIDTQATAWYSEWRELSTPTALCSGGYVTVFLDAKQRNTSGWHINCFDDAVLYETSP